MTREEEINRAVRAREVLENPIYIEAFAKTRAAIEQQWKDSAAGDTNAREQLWVMQKLLGKIESHLSQTMLTGEMATKQLAWQELQAERSRKFAA